MIYLSAVTLLWAFSFSLIGVYLAGQVDSWFSVWMRVALASLVFLPFIKFKSIPIRLILKLMVIGGIQLGLMYCFYYQSFLLLSVPEVLLFTVFTPIYVTLIYDLLKGHFSPWYLVTAAIAVVGAVFIKFAGINDNFLTGFFVVQGANLCFAIGQVAYKYVMEKQPVTLSQHTVFGYFYLGALVVASTAFLLFGNSDKLPTTSLQWGILVYLGLIASGLGYFAWNKGACLVNAGALAIMNNALVPAGLVVNIMIWNRDVDLMRLGIGGSIILLSLWVNETWVKRKVMTQSKTTN
ncbi:carboxylate/amino acid/amine transporter [Vibrio aestuarianus]|uniref:Biotin transporter n=1 Tax=Vibrio aestuarianus TaxID=28171 RepID=A0AAX3U3E5_9VIBR|nr:carboxylate/amino acid/amine transporter [Vibrio aestuarianus]MDE1211207.1 carboxylate/amino acid/amine transporter [Vibrio aestuarianus]MDE1215013.1 carboxylate/amino acid/amine transporter [Vibrio aestuarianus]MDE1218275.1 carboxylate/amino acid/amine transporter [Vibrio aestuarianus]MDE1226817.1 carboxylate/amino acid/amine transporter [Vibrio aestuarianus]MDE1248325.1 carboxylate/amino acid/amine transporter [Vibrio aestuarianus]